MDTFCANFRAMPYDARRAKLDQILAFVRSQNAPEIANAFQELRNCYPVFPLFRTEREFREYLAWGELISHANHPMVHHILSQG
jgi:hypothetical protein